MTIYLIRHGETDHNAARILQPPATPLSERGAQQARLLAARLAAAGIVRIVASDLERAVQTARALETATRAPLQLDALLQERNFGDLRGRPYRELGFDPFAEGYAPPGGESIPVFQERVAKAWDMIQEHAAASAPGALAIVTHGLVCRDLVARHLALPAALAGTPPAWDNTCVTEIDGPPYTVRLLACTAHLST